MDKIKSIAELNGKIMLVLSEQEARALHNITVYGPEEFVKWFYAHMGKHYLQPHERGLRSLFKTIEDELPQHLKKFDEAKKLFDEKGRSNAYRICPGD